MVEFDRNLEREPGVAENLKICVVGVGGAGLNVLDRISLDRMLDATVVAMHTDVRVLTHSMSAAKIQLGADIMRGIGSGGDPELGREAASASAEKISSMIQGHNMIFICCGLGGGTGSGAAPVVAKLAKETGALVFVFATTPFVFEGRRRIQQSELSMAELQKHADALILFENNRMGELVLPKEGIQKAFSQADQLIGHSVRAIATMVTQPGIVRMGLADLMAALNSPNARCLFGFGEARGTNRVSDALKRSLKSPLVNQGQLLQNARNLLVHVAGGESLTLAEVETLMKQLGKCVPETTQIMFGLAVDPRMGDAISVTLVSSLSAQEMTAFGTGQDGENETPVPAPTPVSEVKAPVVAQLEAAPAPVLASEPAAQVEVQVITQEIVQASAPVPAPEFEPKSEPESVVVAASAPQSATSVAEAPAPVVQEQPQHQPVEAPEPAPVVVKAAAARPVPAQAQSFDFEHDLFGAKVTPVESQPRPQAQVETKVHVSVNPQTNGAHQAQVRIVVPKQEPVSEPEVEQEQVVAEQQYAPPQSAPVAEIQQPQSQVVQPVVQVKNIPVEPPVQSAPVAPKSIFSVIDSSDDDEDEEFEGEEVDQEYEEEVTSHQSSSSEDDDDGSHWADKYIQPSSAPKALSHAQPHQQPAVKAPEPKVRETAVAASAGASAPVTGGNGNGFKQGTFNIAEQDAGRFKGTTKTIVEGEDLDVPTWMRLKKKSGV